MKKSKCYNRTWEPNPRGQLFTNDSNNIGKKMMKKMGWSQGKGLGKNLNGDPELLSVRQKLTTTGMGYQGNHHNWIANQDNYDNLLIALQEEHHSGDASSENENLKNVPLSKLEAKSETSRSRVHYKKMVKGKDLSGISTEEMECIIGSKKLRKKLKQEKSFSEDVTVTENDVSLNHVSSENMIEYFAKKMAKKQEALLTDSETKETEEEELTIPSVSKKKKKKKAKKLKENPDSTIQAQNAVFTKGFNDSATDEEICIFSNHNDSLVCKKTKKRKKNFIQFSPDSIASQSKKKKSRFSLENGNINGTSKTVTFNKEVEVFYVPLKDKTRGGALRLMKDSDWIFYDE